MKLMWMVGMAVALVGACGGDDETADDSEPATTAADGATEPTATEDEAFDLGNGVSVVVHEVIDPLDVIRDRQPGMRDAVADPGFRWIAVEIEYTNQTDEVIDMSMSYGGELHTSDGVEAEGWTLQRTDMPELGNTIPPQASLRGWKAFQVAENADPTVFLFYGGKIGDEPVVVEL